MKGGINKYWSEYLINEKEEKGESDLEGVREKKVKLQMIYNAILIF